VQKNDPNILTILLNACPPADYLKTWGIMRIDYAITRASQDLLSDNIHTDEYSLLKRKECKRLLENAKLHALG
jgi:hypothetical protein